MQQGVLDGLVKRWGIAVAFKVKLGYSDVEKVNAEGNEVLKEHKAAEESFNNYKKETLAPFAKMK